MASDILVTTSNQTTTSGNISVAVQIRQTTSSSGKVKLQGRLRLSWQNYADVYYTNNVFDIYLGSSTSGTKLLSSSPDWTRTAAAGSTFTSWVDLVELTNRSSVSLYAVVKPNGSASSPSTLYFSFSVSGIKQTYSLSVSAGTGSSIAVSRQSSTVAGTGSLSNGSVLYAGDVLSVSYSASTGYVIGTHTLNGSTFNSGATHTVSAAVSIVTTASVASFSLSLSAGVGSSITVNRTSSPLARASTGNLSNGATIYYNDVLSISWSASDGYSISSAKVNNIERSGSSLSVTVSSAVSVVVLASVKSYAISVTLEEHSSIVINRTSSPKAGAPTGVVSGNTVYYGDVLLITAIADSGYGIDTMVVNSVSVGNPLSLTVSAPITIIVSVKTLGFVYIDSGAAIGKYKIIIDSGSVLEQYRAMIDTGSQIVPY